MKKIFLFLLFFILVTNSFGQNKDTVVNNSSRKNSIFIEVAGNSLLIGSINYERILHQSNSFSLSGRFGIGFDFLGGGDMASVPVMLNGIFWVSHTVAFEAGLGPTVFFTTRFPFMSEESSREDVDMVLSGQAGLRVQCRSGFLFRLSFTPIISIKHSEFGPASIFDKTFFPWGGLSLGYCFGK